MGLRNFFTRARNASGSGDLEKFKDPNFPHNFQTTAQGVTNALAFTQVTTL
jgi:hypothetical protein